ncbi:hypothetical protein [Actinoplanes subglobosus]|uniref:Uncharacterized protein n=1 Tax=Actinoplanes subglobosus TaxID=1547892 RepID=A0ABV8J8C6_9ACTN
MTDLTTVSAELSALLGSMPDLSTPAADRADWFDRKADLLDRVAVTVPEAAELATVARDRATRIRTGGAA